MHADSQVTRKGYNAALINSICRAHGAGASYVKERNDEVILRLQARLILVYNCRNKNMVVSLITSGPGANFR